jgi:Zn-dependent peptidase ImmA (M78 family)
VNGLRPAEQLLQSLGITDPRDIDLEAIAFDQGAIVKYRPLSGCEARILGYGKRAVITVDNRHLKARVRFSTAHELGHWHSHRGRSLICRPEDIGSPGRNPFDPEVVADSYAADLLLPRYLFVPRANSFGKTTFEALEKLTEEFATSMTATAIRLVEYGPEPAVLVCHGPQGRKWFRRPQRIPERWFPSDELDSDSCAFEVLHSDLRRSRRTLIRASAWFDRRGAGQFQLYEQAFKVADDEILTILIFKDEEMLQGTDY